MEAHTARAVAVSYDDVQCREGSRRAATNKCANHLYNHAELGKAQNGTEGERHVKKGGMSGQNRRALVEHEGGHGHVCH